MIELRNIHQVAVLIAQLRTVAGREPRSALPYGLSREAAGIRARIAGVADARGVLPFMKFLFTALPRWSTKRHCRQAAPGQCSGRGQAF